MNKKYLKEYEITEEGGKRRLVYTGPRFRAEMPEKAFLQIRFCLLGAAVLMAALYTGMGLIGVESTRKLYVGIPYALMVIPVVYACVDAAHFLFIRGEMERVQYKRSFMRLFDWSAAVVVLSAAALIGGVIFMIRSGDAQEWPFVLLSALLGLTAFFFAKQHRILQSKIVEIQ